jgi:TorA maturation chaperone TorD
MRWLIQGGRPLAEQREFFERFVYAGAVPFFAAVQKAPGSAFYRHVAAVAGEYFEVEMAAFGMDDTN